MVGTQLIIFELMIVFKFLGRYSFDETNLSLDLTKPVYTLASVFAGVSCHALLFDLNGCSTYNVSLSGPVVWTVYLFLMSLKELENSFRNHTFRPETQTFLEKIFLSIGI